MACSCCAAKQPSSIYISFFNFLRFINERVLRFLLWKAGLSSVPPHFIKFRIIKEYKDKFNLDTLVETGTYLGDTVAKARGCFSEIYSIEVDEVLFNKAKAKFSCFKGIHILKGDSAKVLPEVTAEIKAPALFWLDAHYSGGITSGDAELSPIVQEVESILKANNLEHVFLIDDAHLFNGQHGYPDMQFLNKLISKYRPHWSVYFEANIIRAHASKQN
jgi:hypothetical protein